MSGHLPVWRTAPKQRAYPAKAFLPLLRAAVAAHPRRTDLVRDLAVALRDDGRWAEIVGLLAPLARDGVLVPELAFELGCAAAASDDTELALSALDAAAAGGVARAYRQKAFLLESSGQHAEAATAAWLALRSDPHDEEAMETAAADLLRRSDAAGLSALCEELEGRGARGARLLAFRAAALALAGRREELATLLDPALWCAQISLGRDPAEDDRLVDTILSHADIAPSAEFKATRGSNLRLAGLAKCPELSIRHLLADVRREIDAYMAVRALADHPLMARRPEAVMLDGWALVMADDGYEEQHIHPKGWLTAVYYLRTPKGEGGGTPPPGSIIFGPWPGFSDELLPEFPRWHLEPRAGTLLIFPSFLGHRTIPTGVAAQRICVTLDVMPVAP